MQPIECKNLLACVISIQNDMLFFPVKVCIVAISFFGGEIFGNCLYHFGMVCLQLKLLGPFLANFGHHKIA